MYNLVKLELMKICSIIDLLKVKRCKIRYLFCQTLDNLNYTYIKYENVIEYIIK